MSRFRLVPVILLLLVVASPAFALNTRSAVATYGSDSYACTIPQPCRTFQVALGATMDGGEIVALDSGGFGTIVIDRAITISAAPGVHAAILPSSGDAMDVNITYPNSSGRVILRNLVLIGTGSANGLNVQNAAEVRLLNCTFRGFFGWSVMLQSGKLTADHCAFIDSPQAIGIDALSNTRATVTNSLVQGNNIGIYASGGAAVVISDTVISENTDGIEAGSNGSLASTEVTVERCAIVNNDTGLYAYASGPLTAAGMQTSVIAMNTAHIQLAESVVAFNSTAATSNGSGYAVLYSFGNNRVYGNTSDPMTYTPIALK